MYRWARSLQEPHTYGGNDILVCKYPQSKLKQMNWSLMIDHRLCSNCEITNNECVQIIVARKNALTTHAQNCNTFYCGILLGTHTFRAIHKHLKVRQNRYHGDGPASIWTMCCATAYPNQACAHLGFIWLAWLWQHRWVQKHIRWKLYGMMREIMHGRLT